MTLRRNKATYFQIFYRFLKQTRNDTKPLVANEECNTRCNSNNTTTNNCEEDYILLQPTCVTTRYAARVIACPLQDPLKFEDPRRKENENIKDNESKDQNSHETSRWICTEEVTQWREERQLSEIVTSPRIDLDEISNIAYEAEQRSTEMYGCMEWVKKHQERQDCSSSNPLPTDSAYSSSTSASDYSSSSNYSSRSASTYSSEQSLDDWSDDNAQQRHHEESDSNTIVYEPVSFAKTVVKKRKIRMKRHSSDVGGDYYFCRTYRETKSRSLKNLLLINKRSTKQESQPQGGSKECFTNFSNNKKPNDVKVMPSSMKRLFARFRQRTSSPSDERGLWMRSWSTPSNLDRISVCNFYPKTRK